MSLLWLTDCHLTHLKFGDATKIFARSLSNENPDATALIITGDISSGRSIENHLKQLADGF